MTTIAFKAGELAADRLLTEGSERYGYGTKIGASKDALGVPVLFAASGASALARRFTEWAAQGLPNGDPPPSMKEDEIKGFGMLFYADGTFITFDPGLPPFRSEMVKACGYFASAIGSGSTYALGAMEMGADAAHAVVVAARFDTHTGGGVDVVSFADPIVVRRYGV